MGHEAVRSSQASCDVAGSRGFSRCAWRRETGDEDDESGQVDRLRQVRLIAGEKRPFSVLGARKRREGQRRKSLTHRLGRANLAHQLIAVHVRHADITDQRIRGPASPGCATPPAPIRADRHRRALLLQDPLHELTGIRFVIDDEHVNTGEARKRGLLFGSRMRRDGLDRRIPASFPEPRAEAARQRSRLGPRPRLLACSVPPCSSTSCLRDGQPKAKPAMIFASSSCLAGKSDRTRTAGNWPGCRCRYR